MLFIRLFYGKLYHSLVNKSRGGFIPNNKVYKILESEFIISITESLSISEALAKMSCLPISNYYKALRKRCEELNLEVPTGYISGRTKAPKPLNELLVENSTTNRGSLKIRLINEGILIEQCFFEDCPTRNKNKLWRGIPLVFQLDHINGVNTDNRLENLRLLCPNCHTQTDTYCGKNNQGKTYELNHTAVEIICPKCGNPKDRKAKVCKDCYVPPKKIDWPCDDELWERIDFSNFVQVGKDLGISDNAIRKHLGLKK